MTKRLSDLPESELKREIIKARNDQNAVAYYNLCYQAGIFPKRKQDTELYNLGSRLNEDTHQWAHGY